MHKTMKKTVIQFGLFLTICVLALQAISWSPAYAQAPSSLNVGQYLRVEGQENQPTDIAAFIVRAVSFLALTIGSFAFVAIVIGGIALVTAAGRENQVQKGKDIIKYAIIGLIVALSAYFITAFVQSIFFEYQSPQ